MKIGFNFNLANINYRYSNTYCRDSCEYFSSYHGAINLVWIYQCDTRKWIIEYSQN
jgi:hypothetical protein